MPEEPFTRDYILRLHREVVRLTGGSQGVRDAVRLESALAQPFQGFGGVDLYPGAAEKAACLLFGLIEDHPFADGNKRTACVAALAYLACAGYAVEASDDELHDLVLGTAAGRYQLGDVAAWLAPRLRPSRP